MGRKLMGNTQFAPSVLIGITEKVEGFFQGTLLDRQMAKTTFGEKPVFKFLLEDTDMPTRIKQDKEYVATDVKQGQTVSIFAPTLLDKALVQASPNDKIRIVYKGKGNAKKGRNAPHVFDVEVL
jgi:hypothetical protein